MIESKNAEFAVGAYIVGSFGWRTHTVFNPNNADDFLMRPYVLPSFGDLPLSLGLGLLGMPGNLIISILSVDRKHTK